MNDRFDISDYFNLLIWFSEFVGLIVLDIAPFIVSFILAICINYLFLLLLLIYLPLIPLAIILWDKFLHQEDD